MSAATLDDMAHRAPARRVWFFSVVVALIGTGTWLFSRVLATNGLSIGEIGLLVVFSVTFSVIALSFTVATVGFVLLLLRRDPITMGRLDESLAAAAPALRTRTALLIPIYNEDVDRVMACALATYRSLSETGRSAQFDLFLLSDTRDETIAAAEERAWRVMCAEIGADMDVYYRRRPDNAGRKAGNIAEWVRRNGAGYETMIVLDADSVMAGGTLVELVRLMEANPRTGIIQTMAIPVGRRSFFGRAVQFATALYGPIFATGHSFWQMGEANYFGHNAIIRTRAFAASCGLPSLPGGPPLGGDIMSHDFVEAACMRRGGWLIWSLPNLGGSFEEVPSNILDYAARDRRWAQGNMQHARLVGVEGFHWVSRLHLVLGVLSFVTSPLWLLLLLLSTGVTIEQTLATHAYFPASPALFPIWPEFRPAEGLALLLMTLVLLFAPKLLAAGLAMARRRDRRSFGGAARLATSFVLELAFSTLLAPVLMLFQSGFVTMIALGRSVGWNAQARDDRGVSWRSAMRRHWIHVVLGVAWAGAVLHLAPGFAPWIGPVVIGMIVAVPLTVLSSRAMRDSSRPLFTTPAETERPPVLRLLDIELGRRLQRQVSGAMRASELPASMGVHVANARSSYRAPTTRPSNQ